MVYLIGQHRKTKKDIWAGRFKCESCCATNEFHLYTIKNVFSIFFIPFISTTEKRLLVCDKCNVCYEITKEKYKEIKTQQEQRIKNGDIPDAVILQDYNPKELKYGVKIFGLICSLLFFFIMFASSIGMAQEIGDYSAIIGLVIMLSIGAFPLVFSIRATRKAKKGKLIYNQVIKNRNTSTCI